MPIANEYAEELPRAKYSRDAENQLDNQVERAENEDEIITGYAELEELANDKNNRANDYYKKIKARVDKAIEPNINALLDNIIQDVSKNFLELFNESNSQKDTHILLGDRRKGEVLQRWAVYATKFVEKPSNYKEALRERFISSQALDKLSREQLISCYNLYRDVAKEMYEYGSYVCGELCEELARGGTGLYNRRNREDVRGGNVTRHELEQIIAGTRIFRLNPERIKYITALFGKQALEKLNIPKHPHEAQNSRDVSAFSFGENPLSEQPLKAKAELETPLGKLEKASSQIIEEIVADAMSSFESAEQIMRAIERCSHDMNVSLWSKNGSSKALKHKRQPAVPMIRQNGSSKAPRHHRQPAAPMIRQNGSSEAPRHHRQPAAPMICQNGSSKAPRHHRQSAAPMIRQPSQPFWQVSFP